MKANQRFDYSRLAEVLQERGMVEPTVLRELLAQAQTQGGGFTEALVVTGHVSDWDLSRVVCEIFQLPFVPVNVLAPDAAASDGLDKQFLLQHALVPMGRFGQVLTISMPALVPAEVLGMLAAESDLVVLPVVGTVQTNRAWVEEHLGVGVEAKNGDAGWSELFDDADAAVLLDLQKVHKGGADGELEFAIDSALDEGSGDLGGLEYEPGAGDDTVEPSIEPSPEYDSESVRALDPDAPGMGPSEGGAELPPLPKFSA